MRSAGASLPAIRRPHRAELVNTSKNFCCRNPANILVTPFILSIEHIIFSKVCRAVVSQPTDVFKISKNEGSSPYTLPSDHSDTKYVHCILPGNEPVKYFLRRPFGSCVYDEKIYPGRPGHAEEIFSKIFPGTLAPV